jgi:hypothetical protein
MHSPTHELFILVAINLLFASPFLAYLLERRGLFGDRTRTVTVAEALVVPLAAVSVGAAAIHLASLHAELDVAAPLAILFGGAAVVQVLWAVLWLRRPAPGLATLAVAVNVLLVLAWIASRGGDGWSGGHRRHLNARPRVSAPAMQRPSVRCARDSVWSAIASGGLGRRSSVGLRDRRRRRP